MWGLLPHTLIHSYKFIVMFSMWVLFSIILHLAHSSTGMSDCNWVFAWHRSQTRDLLGLFPLAARPLEQCSSRAQSAIIRPWSTFHRNTMPCAPAWGEGWLWDWAEKGWQNREWCLVAGTPSHILFLFLTHSEKFGSFKQYLGFNMSSIWKSCIVLSL